MEPRRLEPRRPIVNREAAAEFPSAKIEQQWGILTAAIRAEVLTDPRVREVLRQIETAPLSERLPGEAIGNLARVSPRIAQLWERWQQTLGAYLALESVPDELLVPDISGAVSNRLSPTEVVGVTPEERQLVAQRYRFGRDLKILGLGAELVEQPVTDFPADNQLVLPSGVRLGVLDPGAAGVRDLLNPTAWERRRQLKDRVHEVWVGGRQYILKERKTARHTDTKKTGHRAGAPSADEISHAQHFAEISPVECGLVQIRWEKPIGWAEYPDGFQFALFDYEPRLLSSESAMQQLAFTIAEHQEQFADEFAELKRSVEAFITHPAAVGTRPASGGAIGRLFGQLREYSQGRPTLTWPSFARVKAFYLIQESVNLMRETLVAEGYSNTDFDGYAYRSNQERPGLELVGFDFEYYTPDPQLRTSEQRATRLAEMRQQANRFETAWGMPAQLLGERVTAMERACYYAMRQHAGRLDQEKMDRWKP